MGENEHVRAHSIGATGGLPGANADPRASRLTADELASTVSRGDPPDPGSPASPEALGVDRDVGTDSAVTSRAEDPERIRWIGEYQYSRGSRDERGREIVDTPLPD
jgi:hypothetical protein